MNKVTIVKAVAGVIGVLTAVTLISTHPVQVTLLVVSVVVFIKADKVNEF